MARRPRPNGRRWLAALGVVAVGAAVTTSLVVDPPRRAPEVVFADVDVGNAPSTAPRSIVGVDEGQDAGLVVFDAATGAVLGELDATGGEGLGEVSLSSTGDLFFTVLDGPEGLPSIHWLPADGGARRVLVDAAEAPAASPDGGSVAYLQVGRLAVRDLATDDVRVRPFADPDLTWDDVAWSPDGGQLALLGGDGQGPQLRVLDAESDASFEDAEVVEGSWTGAMAWRQDGILAVASEPCATRASVTGCVVLVDLAGGSRQVLADVDGVLDLDWDDAGEHLLVVAGEGDARVLLDVGLDGTVRPLETGDRRIRSAQWQEGQSAASAADVAPSTTTTTTTSTSVPPVAPRGEQPDRPTTAVALTRVGALVLVDTASAEVVRTLVGASPGEVVSGPALSPDGTTVFYSIDREDYTSSVRSIPITGGTATEVADGRVPALSPDGRRLAWAANREPEKKGLYNTLAVRDLGSGEEVRLGTGEPFHGGASLLEGITWAPDGERIAMVTNFEAGDLIVVDVGRPPPSSLAEANAASLGTWLSPEWLPDGRIAVVVETLRARAIDPDSGEEVSLGLAEDGGVVVASDPTGRHLLVSDGTGLSMVVPGERPVLLARDVLDADW